MGKLQQSVIVLIYLARHSSSVSPIRQHKWNVDADGEISDSAKHTSPASPIRQHKRNADSDAEISNSPKHASPASPIRQHKWNVDADGESSVSAKHASSASPIRQHKWNVDADGEISESIPQVSSSIAQSWMTSGSTSNDTLANAFARVPMKFIVITKNDGKVGHVPRENIESRMSMLNKYFAGVDPMAWTEEMARELNSKPNTFTASPGFPFGTCSRKCEISLCYGGGKFKSIVDASNCFCGEDFCKDSTVLALGELKDSGIRFSLQSVTYVDNAGWHDKCCCAHADRGYKDKQVEIVDKLVDKSSVRSVVTVIVCDMGASSGQAIITGKKGDCPGGPFIMLTTNFRPHALTHETGHYFGLHHTFHVDCPSENFGECKASDVCNPARNLGDHIDDTPLHKKQGQCYKDADSCPNVAGQDPLDNIMSYSACDHVRFTPGQVEKMRQIITEYYPAFLIGSSSRTGKDFPCNPEFTSGLPSGYAPPTKAPTSAPTNAPTDPPTNAPTNAPATGCSLLKPGQCDTHDTTGCTCQDASICCQKKPERHGCAGYDSLLKMCIPCSWKSWSGFTWTSDSCN